MRNFRGEQNNTVCQILFTCSSTKKSPSKPPLTKIHKENHRAWSVQYLKQDFNFVLFTDEILATLDGLDGWSCGWVAHGRAAPTRFKRQQGGNGVMIWAGIIGDKLVGPFKLTRQDIPSFLRRICCHGRKEKSAAFKKKMVFM